MAGQPDLRSFGRAREGTPWKGMWAVIAKEMADHLTSARMLILELLILLTAAGTVYAALQNLRDDVNRDAQSIFLQLFTTAQEPLPAFVGFLGILVPLIAIALTFDSVNGEFNQRTLSRVLAQPVYRDALLMGKFLGALFTLALVLASIWLLIMGLGILGMGVAPTGDEFARIAFFLILTIFYGGAWLALALVLSTVFRQPATAALGAIAVWLFVTVFWNMIAGVIARTLRPALTGSLPELLAQAELLQSLNRFSPNTLYAEATIGLLHPNTRALGFVLPSQLEGAILGAPLPLVDSLLLVWPNLTVLIALTIALFVAAYILFQRQEIRA